MSEKSVELRIMKMEKAAYRSVKEAVELYGQRILAPELYANVLREMDNEENERENNLLKIKSVRDELDVAKQNLEKAKERSVAMTRSLSSLQEELEGTKHKLQMLKKTSDHNNKLVGGFWKNDFKTQSQRFEEEEENEVGEKGHMIVDAKMNGERCNNSPSKKKKIASMKKSMFFIGSFFSKTK